MHCHSGVLYSCKKTTLFTIILQPKFSLPSGRGVQLFLEDFFEFHAKIQTQPDKYLLRMVLTWNTQQKSLCWCCAHEPLSYTLSKLSPSGDIKLIHKYWRIALLPSGKILRYYIRSILLLQCQIRLSDNSSRGNTKSPGTEKWKKGAACKEKMLKF